MALQENRSWAVACILTRNEEDHIVEAIRSAQLAVDQVVVVDSESTDETVSRAQKAGAHILSHPFESFPSQRNWALDRIREIFGDCWVLALDADERVTEALAREVRGLSRGGSSADVYLIRRRLRFGGKVLRFGGYSSVWLARFFRASAGAYEDRQVNEHFAPHEGVEVSRLKGDLLHEDVISWERYIEKHNLYTSLEAEAQLYSQQDELLPLRTAIKRPELRRRWLRHHIVPRLPARPLFRFLYIYLLRGGFLDGSAGFNMALFRAWNEMLIQYKFRELTED